MKSEKSGEIFRIGHGSYCFLCSHCGFSFVDLKDILNHIDTHFVGTDIPTTNSDSSKDAKESTIRSDVTQMSSSEDQAKILCVEELQFKIGNDEVEDDVKVFDAVAEEPLRIEHKGTNLRTNRVAKSSGKNRVKKSKELIGQEQGQERDQELRDNSDLNEPKQCPICEKNYENHLTYQSHLRTVHRIYGNKIFQCYICGLYCRYLHLLKTHLSCGLHSKPNPNCYQCELDPPVTNEIDVRPHKCVYCKQWFENHIHFRKHFKDDHHQDVDKFFSKKANCNEFTCYICKKDFALKNYLKTHMKVHNDNKAFVCDFCGKRYRTGAILTRHLNTHEGKTYPCGECGKTFGYYARLRIHRYSHRTELNYKCEVCSKAFKVQKYLARHMKTHRGEKEYACRYCDKRFTFSTGRRTHEVTQHGAV